MEPNDHAINLHISIYDYMLCPDPYCRVCRDETGEVRPWLEECWEREHNEDIKRARGG